ncbi:nucleotide exchange factor GrpE, partial [Candidatus Bathyarchaeota archaeon]|nr:nucleotide exchange factor GrpE [Candidatus Bathyarchaeota archaeon]
MSYILDEKENVDNPDGETVEAPQAKSAQAKKNERTTLEPPPDLGERVSELEEALRQEKNKSDDLYRRLQYLQADFENYRKRVDKEIGDAKRYGNERLLSELLTVKDEFELAY